MKNRRDLLVSAALTAAALLATVPVSASAHDSKIQLMFVQTADGFKADAKTFRLVNVAKQTLFFADRPVRLAGHVTMPAYDRMEEGRRREQFRERPAQRNAFGLRTRP